MSFDQTFQMKPLNATANEQRLMMNTQSLSVMAFTYHRTEANGSRSKDGAKFPLRLLTDLNNGDHGMTRPCDLRFRKPSLYPAELRDRRPRRGRRVPGR